jgi:hypothetical protein
VIGRVLIDTGPLVAVFSARDSHHEICSRQLSSIAPPLLTSWPVLTEAAWLLRRQAGAIERILESVTEGLLQPLELDEAACAWMAGFLRKYRSLHPQIADASLVYLAEREGLDAVFTLDRRDFLVYRLSGNRKLNLLPAS